MTRAAGHQERGRRDGWHLLREGGVLTLTRRLPARFDLSASTVLPTGGRRVGRARLAHQIRQDVWRRLQGLRGFMPAVRIEQGAEGVHVTAGGALDAAAPLSWAQAALAEVLADPACRARWIRHAEARS
ncbi:hypothetical protein ACFQ3C_01070 [Seohaeicola saemankumensis]|uniref:Uncharacterized protein n=1 Tax=Seohaeicola saemankumensis TaxID=481181 RepID=A0ABW3T8N1_9RHOB